MEYVSYVQLTWVLNAQVLVPQVNFILVEVLVWLVKVLQLHVQEPVQELDFTHLVILVMHVQQELLLVHQLMYLKHVNLVIILLQEYYINILILFNIII